MTKQTAYMFIGVIMILFSTSSWADKLGDIHQAIIKKYANVKHIKANDFSDRVSKQERENIVVFDVREPDEFEVSHLDNAIRVDPSIKADEFFELFGDKLSGKTAVFYCSVGRRSSKLINRLEESDHDLDMLNLESGIFRWTNETRPVEGVGVHPYNWFWSRLIDDKKLIHYSPLNPNSLPKT